jgi:hypothetical protein
MRLKTVPVAVFAAALLSTGTAGAAPTYVVPIPATNPHERPAGYRLDAAQARQVADASAAVRGERAKGQLVPRIYAVGDNWQVSYFRGSTEVARAVVDGRRPLLIGRVLTGPYVLYPAARGTRSTFLTRRAWTYLLLTVLFIVPFVHPRGRPRLAHLDLLALASIAADELIFSYGHLYASVPLMYPPLLYLGGRCLWRTYRPAPGDGLDSWLSTRALMALLAALVVFRTWWTLAWGVAGDVGFASMFGADSILHGFNLYTVHPAHFDTYGPLNYLLYTPFDAIWPLRLGGGAGRLTGALVASLAADLTVIGLLFFIGRKLRPGADSTRMGVILAFAWAACPATFLALVGGSNDVLVAVFVLAPLLALQTPALRGALVGFGGAVKFAPLCLIALIARGQRFERRATAVALAACAIVFVLVFVPYVEQSGARTVWRATLGYQLGRTSPFTLWGLHPSLGWLHPVFIAIALGLFGLTAVRPRADRTLVQIAAASAALLIAFQLAANVWWHGYADWFAGPVLIALLAGRRERVADAPATTPEHPLIAVPT